jgi:hypothetical protein
MAGKTSLSTSNHVWTVSPPSPGRVTAPEYAMEPEELSFKVVVGAAGPCGSRRRALIFFGLAAAVLGLATLGTQSSSAQTPGPEFKPLLKKLVRARCHMDVCGWFSIETATPVGASPKGQLYVLASRSWESEHKGGKYDRPAPRTGGNVGIDFVFARSKSPLGSTMTTNIGEAGWRRRFNPGNSKVMAGCSRARVRCIGPPATTPKGSALGGS